MYPYLCDLCCIRLVLHLTVTHQNRHSVEKNMTMPPNKKTSHRANQVTSVLEHLQAGVPYSIQAVQGLHPSFLFSCFSLLQLKNCLKTTLR